jgi:tripartite-type tricarboxylate transporter receptor subunit TctC
MPSAGANNPSFFLHMIGASIARFLLSCREGAMKFQLRRLLQLAAGAVFITVASGILFSDAWSQTRTIKLIVPYPPGGAVDFAGRLLAEEITKTQGSKIVIEDRPGAGTVIGTEAASRAAPDGNALLIVSTSFVVVPHFRKLNYDPLTSFEPICSLRSSLWLTMHRRIALSLIY